MDYTKEYYNKYSPSYSVSRMEIIVKWIEKLKKPRLSLIDIGCGDGSALAFLSEKTGLGNIAGLDSSLKYLKNAKKTYKGIKFLIGDVCDINIKEKYDIVIISAVLHHIIGSNRTKSKMLSILAVRNCLDLLKDDGRIIIMEPVFSNKFLMSFLFYLKKIVSKFSNDRVTVLGYWNNIGAPVVSYFSAGSLRSLIEESGGLIVLQKYIPAPPNKIYRLLRIKRGDYYLQVKPRET